MNILLLCLLVLVRVTCTLQHTTDANNPDSKRFLPFPIDKRGTQNTTLQVPLDNGHLESAGGAYYFVTIDVGTPPQTMKILLDTGSNDFWVYGSKFCGQGGGCCRYSIPNIIQGLTRIDNENKSTSASSTNLLPFLGRYGGGGDVQEFGGPFMTDKVNVGGVMLENVTLAVIDSSNTGKAEFGGILGLGWDNHEAQHIGNTIKYPDLVDVLYKEGHIQSHTYSLHLDDIGKISSVQRGLYANLPSESGSGTILFGGYDAAKYTGPQIPLSAGKSSLDVPLQAISITDASGTTTEVGFYEDTIPAILDCGTPFSGSLPNNTYTTIIKHLQSLGYNFLHGGQGTPYVNCTLRDAQGSINLNFTDTSGNKSTNPYFGNTITIAVPFSELVLNMSNTNSGPEYCKLGISNAGSGRLIFGDTFMRSMYIVFAFKDYGVIALAQAKFNASASNIVPVPIT